MSAFPEVARDLKSGDEWWTRLPELAATSLPANLPHATYRFAAKTLEIQSAHPALLAEFESAYGDCREPDDAVPGLRCRAIPAGGSIVALHFEAEGLPPLFEAALSLVRPRETLQHFDEAASGHAGWRLLGNRSDGSAPLLAASERCVLIDVLLEPPEFLLNLIVGVVQLLQPAIVFVHGGAVTIGGRGVLLTGRSGAGKSTTTAALAARGHPLLGDETVGLKADPPRLFAFRRTMKLRPGPRPRLVEERLPNVRQGWRIDANGVTCAWVRPSDLFPGAPAEPVAPLTDVFFLRGFASRPRIEPFAPSLDDLDELRGLTMSLSAVVSWTLSPSRRLMRFAQLTELFSHCRCYHVDLGPPDETAAAIEERVRQSWA